jgi:hypothetical protein
MDWIKTNYEKVALLVCAVAAVAGGALLVTQILALPELFAGRDSPKPPDHSVKPPEIARLGDAAATLAKPREWTPSEGSLFVSRPYVLKDGQLVDPLEGGAPLHPPIPNAWLIKYDLDYADSSIKELDPDNDGFTVLEEYQGGTDPTDKASTPPFHTKLRLQRFIATPFRLIFTGTPDDGQTFTINAKDLKSRTQFRQIGEMIEGSPYKITGYTKKSETRDEIERDVSELAIENTATGQKLVLVANQETNDPTSYAEFLYLLDNSTFRVKKDDEFSIQPEPDRKYKLIDINEQEAVIQSVADGEQIKVSRSKD